ncbi:hypothetical protein AMR41_26615 [Hapalosiphon sp. MRB220]|nr:hypothetical protein AMR41_26615 [Hapalosiphon sp. MRB220]
MNFILIYYAGLLAWQIDFLFFRYRFSPQRSPKQSLLVPSAESVVLCAGVLETQMKCDRRRCAPRNRVASPLENRFSSCKIHHNDRFFQ